MQTCNSTRPLAGFTHNDMPPNLLIPCKLSSDTLPANSNSAPGPAPHRSASLKHTWHSNTNKRKGHKYQHSSISLNLFKHANRQPLSVPASLPVPSVMESYHSMSRDQFIAVLCSLAYLFAVIPLLIVDSPFNAVPALARLLFHDAVAALICSVVGILSNFDVWNRSSVHLPFGLQRAEVLAGYALSVSSIFMGADILSHLVQDAVQALCVEGLFNIYTHTYTHFHSHHSHTNLYSLSHTPTLLAAFVTSNSVNKQIDSTFCNKFKNTSHILSTCFSIAILLYPIIAQPILQLIDTLLTLLISASMCYIGWTLAKSLAGMLVMSYPGEDCTDDIATQVAKLSHVTSVENISIWKVHHSLWLACMKIKMIGSRQDENTVREDAARLVKEIMPQSDVASSDHSSSIAPPSNPLFNVASSNNSSFNAASSNNSSFNVAPSRNPSKTHPAFAHDPVSNAKPAQNTPVDPVRWEITIDIDRVG